jgi:hypothetical protein
MVMDSKDNGSNVLHPLDSPLQSSPRDFESFKEESHIWADMVTVINERIEILVDTLITTEEEKDLYKLQSEIRVWKEMLHLPDYLKEWSELEHKVKEESNA